MQISISDCPQTCICAFNLQSIWKTELLYYGNYGNGFKLRGGGGEGGVELRLDVRRKFVTQRGW